MKKDNLIKLISKSSGQKRKKCESAFDTITLLISKSLRNKRNVVIDNFGSFCIKERKLKSLSLETILKK
ncbi:MAG: HU family DNA-binding protein [Ignavibacteria bacterium]|nr:HU family DNA-binding protein [Ignavibacteria bacterium]